MGTNKHTLKLYWQQIRYYKPSFFTALVCIPAGALFIDTLLPYFLSQTIGGLATTQEATVWHALMLAAFVGLAGAISNLVGFQALTRHEASVRMGLSDATFATLMQKDMGFFVNEKVGALTSRYIDFIRSHVILQDLFIIRTLGFAINVGVGLVIVAIQSWLVAVVISLLIIGLIIQVKWSIKNALPGGTNARNS